MYYEIHGSGEPLVLIHGLSMDSSTWFNQVPLLSQKYQVVVFDNRGVGQTDAPHEDYSTEMMADDTVALLRFLNVDNAHILGFSMGGMIAQIIALKYPELVKSLLLNTTAAQFPAKAKHLVQNWLRMLNENVSLETRIREGFLWVYTDTFFEHDEQSNNRAGVGSATVNRLQTDWDYPQAHPDSIYALPHVTHSECD
ncbi:MAG: alpha/beta hydrolase [Cyanobacteria bacterium P01_F01_bin.53]